MYKVKTIRAQYQVDGKKINQLAGFHGYSWSTVKNMVELSEEDLERRGKRNRAFPVATPEVRQAISNILKEEVLKNVPVKQRHTARCIFRDLTEQGIYKGSERRLETLVKEERRKLGISMGASYLPLTIPLGSQVQIDHGEAEIQFAGLIVTAYLFVATIPGAMLRFAKLYPTKARESWGDFFEKCFAFFNGIFPLIVVDNDSVLIHPKTRQKTEFCLDAMTHYGFDVHFCNKNAGWEKGSVENGVGYVRRNYLTGLPEVDRYECFNENLANKLSREVDQGDDDKKRAMDQLPDLLRQIKPERTWYACDECRVDGRQLVRNDNQDYSVPEQFIGSMVSVCRTPFLVRICTEGKVIAEHERQYGKKGLRIQLMHYLKQLKRKPRAAAPFISTHRQSLPELFLRLHDGLLCRFSEYEAAQQLVDILLLSRKFPSQAVHEAIELLLSEGVVNFSMVEYLSSQLHGSTECPQDGACLRQRYRELLPSDLTPIDLSIYNRAVGGLPC
ncbi:MAG: hypothetical protein ABIE92_03210 [bacterium]